MPSITGGLNGAPAADRFRRNPSRRFEGWRSLVGVELGYGCGGSVGSVPTINTTLGACEGLDVVWLH